MGTCGNFCLFAGWNRPRRTAPSPWSTSRSDSASTISPQHGRDRAHLVRLEEEVDPNLEAAAIHRRVFRAGGPAVYFARVKGCRFPMVSNLFGTLERARFMFRDTLPAVRRWSS